MGLGELILLAVGLSMDAFAVSICKGLASKKAGPREMGCCGIWFGGFQALMPLIGFFLGSLLSEAIVAFDHWIAFILLVLIGGNMLREAFSQEDEADNANDNYGFQTMFVMAVATSIDALAVGVTMALAGNVNIWLAIALIGSITFLTSALGVKIGNVFGSRFEKKAEVAGGIILIVLGIKILLEHLGLIK